jgi:hypothetical protein
VLLLLGLACGCGAQLAALGRPPDAEELGLIRAERGLTESEEDCVDELRADAAASGATHVEVVAHHDAYYSGVSYHFPETSRPAWCEGLMYVARGR